MTIFQLLEKYMKRHAVTGAFYQASEDDACFVLGSEFVEQVCRVADYFRNDRGYTKCRIGLLGENSYMYVVYLFGIMVSGNIAVPLNQTYSDSMLEEQIKKAQITTLYGEDIYLEDLTGFSQEMLYSMERTYAVITERMSPEPIVLQQDVTKPDDVCLMLFSSGTSGVSKMVQLTQRNLTTFPLRVWSDDRMEGRNSMMVLPFYHIGGIILLLEDLMLGNRILISSAKYLMRDIRSTSVEKLIVVPSMMKKILDQCDKSKHLEQHLLDLQEALCIGAAMDADLISRLKARGIAPKTYYGMTETTGTVSGLGVYKDGACGKIEDFCQVKITDGEILVKGDNVMYGYFQNDEETKQVLKDGWLYTGDLGEIDKEGYLYIRGRKKNIIILSNGENICPEELENRLYQCPDISECIVYEEDDCICVKIYVSDTSKEASVREYVKEVNRHLPPAHRIKETHLTHEELPKNAMGKLLR